MIRIPQAELVPLEVRSTILRRYEQLLLSHEPYTQELIALLRSRVEYPDLLTEADIQSRCSIKDGEKLSEVYVGDFFLLDYFVYLMNTQVPSEDVDSLLPDEKKRKMFDFFRDAYAFCAKWKLPVDLWESIFYEVVLYPADCALALADAIEAERVRIEEISADSIRADFTQEMLEALARLYAIPLDAPDLDFRISEVLKLPRPVFSVAESWISVNPITPPQLTEYNPITETRESYLARVQQMVDAYCEQVEAGWRGAGWRGGQAFSHYRNPQYLQRLAKQAFMRVVLGMGWGAIRNALDADGMFIEARSTIKRSTERAIELLQITERYESVFYLPLHQQLWAKQGEVAERMDLSDAS